MNWGTDDSSLRVTNEQRDRVLDHINDAYAHGAIDDMERERRAETIISANALRTRRELSQSAVLQALRPRGDQDTIAGHPEQEAYDGSRAVRSVSSG